MTGPALALVDYGAGNLGSVRNALRAIGAAPLVTANPDEVARADRVILPGVGAFGHAMAALDAIDGMIEALLHAAEARARPFLGICIGMQLLAGEGTEPEPTPGLGWIPGRVSAIPARADRKVPHMGWNDVRTNGLHPVVADGEAYFLHGFAFEVDHDDQLLALTDHGGPIAAAVGRDTLVGVQFHPEKSQRYGLETLARFLDWKP